MRSFLNTRRVLVTRAAVLAAGLSLLSTSGCLEDPGGVLADPNSDVFVPDDPVSPTGSGGGNAGRPSEPTGGAAPSPAGTTGTTPSSEPAPPPKSDPPPPPPASDPPATNLIVSTANSITATAAGVRNDPEGVAAPANVTLLKWRDARGADRAMTLGGYLYQYDFSFDDNQNVVLRSANDDAWGHEGFGYVVSHNSQNGNSPLGKANVPTRVETKVLLGGHHALHRVELFYDRNKEGGGNGIQIPVVIEWMVATGRDHPVWAVTWKAGEIINLNNINLDAYRMDVRGPYGSLNFDGAASRNQGDAIGGVAWGDCGYRFTTTDAQLTMNSPWTYNTANSVNFTRAWTANVNAEMGIVQTRGIDKEMGYGDRVVGRERGATSAANFLNKGDCTGFGDNRNYVMPCINGWPYQLMNYDWYFGGTKPLGEASGTKLIAWGSPYGWLGASSFDLFDYSGKGDGRGDRSYATFIVLGPKARYNPQNGAWDRPGDVELAIRSIEALAGATITNVTKGEVAALAAKGPGALQQKNLVSGYNDTYAAHYLKAADNQAAFTFTPPPGTAIRNPVFVVQNYTLRTRPAITVDGAPVSVNSGDDAAGAFVSLDEETKELWVTLNRTISAAATVAVAP